jgi:AraC-like DNA-binding protein
MTPDLTDISSRLAHAPGIRSGSADGAVAALSTSYRPHRLHLANEASALDFRHHAIDCEEASVNFLRYGPELTVDAGSFDTFYMLEFPVSGGVDLAYGDKRLGSHAGTGLLLSPGAYIRSTWRADTSQVMLRLKRSFVERAWQSYTGDAERRTPVFRAEIDLGSVAGRRIMSLIGLIVTERLDESAAPSSSMPPSSMPPSSMPLINAVLQTVFEHAPALSAPRVESALAGAVPHYVSGFRKLLDNPANLQLAIADLAALLGVTPRTLTAGMRRFTGLSPHEYLTGQRMNHARALLRHGGISVAEAARKVGYANAGRFAASFRGHSGMNPSRLLDSQDR